MPNYLDPQTLAAIQSVELRSRLIVEGLMTGMHRSPMQGVSVEFAQHKPYVAGDDTRFLDWKIFGKTDRLFLKQFVKETNLDVMILLDCSGSMGYSSLDKQPTGWTNRWSKWNHACCIASAIASIALFHQDRVGLSLFADRYISGVRFSNASNHWQSLSEAMDRTELVAEIDETDVNDQNAESLSGRTDLAGVIDRTVTRLSQRSLVVLISDLFDDPEHLESGLRRLRFFRGRGHDALILQVLDPAETGFDFRSPTDFIGLEGEGRLPLDPSALRQAYRDVVADHLERVEAAARKFNFDYLRLNTSESLGPPLSHFFARRASILSKR
jgi:uncharacterized protein (DUF58 family)